MNFGQSLMGLSGPKSDFKSNGGVLEYLKPSCSVAGAAGWHCRVLALNVKGLGKAALADSTTVQDCRTVRSPPGMRTEGATLASLVTFTCAASCASQART